MSQCLQDQREGIRKPRSGAGLGKGSHSSIQRPVEPLFTYPNERMGFVQQAGGRQRVASRAHVSSQIDMAMRGKRWPKAGQEKAHFAPHPTAGAAGASLNFFQVFGRRG